MSAKAAAYTDDPTLVMECHIRAADAGHPESQYYVGTHSNYYSTITKYLSMAAEQDHKLAAFHLALIYESGRPGIAPNPEEAFKLYEKCVQLGHWQAVQFLASCYEKGIGCQKDDIKAFKLLEDQKPHLEPWVLHTLGKYHRDGVGTERNMGKAVECFEKAAAVGNPHSHLALAEYLKETGKQQDKAAFHYAAAINVFMQLANRNDEASSESLLHLGKMYSKGIGIGKDERRALEFYEAAAKRGDKLGQHHSGLSYFNGSGCLQNDTIALHYFKQSADQKYKPAFFMLGEMSRNGRGGPRDYSKALDYYHLAGNEPRALNAIGTMYQNGEGVEQSEATAKDWFQRAIDNGYTI
ncbi:hypothetical protein BDR26DRAFT_899409 [Obelidium mucronatum]|nr:hypothetical protein BDR26DRAFT_899409 [Obelidium mucronatum]